MGSVRLVILGALALLYFVLGNVLSRRAMKHLKGPVQLVWLETPVVDPDLFTDEGKRLIRVLRLYYVAGGLGLIAVGALLNRIG